MYLNRDDDNDYMEDNGRNLYFEDENMHSIYNNNINYKYNYVSTISLMKKTMSSNICLVVSVYINRG